MTTRRLRLVPPLVEPECRFADGQHGDCGGPNNGRECWDHVTCARGRDACGHPVVEPSQG